MQPLHCCLESYWGYFLFNGKRPTLVSYPSQRISAEITKFHHIMMKQNEDMKKMTGKIIPCIHPENLSFVNAHKTAS